MSLSAVLFLLVRPLHVLLAAAWLGATAFIVFLLTPAVDESGPAGGQLMLALNRKGLTPFFASLAGSTVLTGIYLFWRFTGGFDPEVSRTHAGMAFGAGGVAGFLALIVGIVMISRPSKKLVEIMGEAVRASDGPAKASLLQRASALRVGIANGTKVVLALQVIALVLMAIAHYI
jgi:uncharacterized membrane protein